MININIYYDGPLINPEETDGFPFKGPGIECYYMMTLKTLNDLEMKIMEELKLNPAFYDIKIIYHYPQEVLHERINYKYMAIKEDKHVKIMFNRIHKMPQVKATELYINSELLVEVGAKKVQQTTTSLQFTTLDDGCTTMGGYTLLHQKTHLGEEDDDEDYAANNGETLCESAFFVTLRPKDPGPE